MVGTEAYKDIGLPAKQAEAAFSRVQGVLDGQVEVVIAFLRDRPVSVAITVLSGESAGVYWVGTVPGARGKGFGELCTQRATNLGFSRGAKLVTLQASAQGNPIYRRMGYREYDRRYDFRRPKP
jgi:ribosomal protein S18 acetylase RimI-like enzyme